MEPLSRPSYNEGYIHVGTDGYDYHTQRAGGYAYKIYGQSPCKCCTGYKNFIHCQYGSPCFRNVGARKFDRISCNL